jgi:hypothetical protein
VRRLLRILLTTATLLSTLLLAATLTLWARGFWFDEHFYAYPDTPRTFHTVALWSYRNGFCLGHFQWARSPNDRSIPLERSRVWLWMSRPTGGAGWARGFGPGTEVRWKFASRVSRTHRDARS